jgi:hypothetical protein
MVSRSGSKTAAKKTRQHRQRGPYTHPNRANVQAMSLGRGRAMNHSPEAELPELGVNCCHTAFLHVAKHGCASVGGQKCPQSARTGRTVAWKARRSGRGEAIGGLGQGHVYLDVKLGMRVLGSPFHDRPVRPPPPMCLDPGPVRHTTRPPVEEGEICGHRSGPAPLCAARL